MASFLYCSSNYRDSDSYRSFRLLKALAKSNGNLFGIASKSLKSNNYHYLDSLKSDNFRESNQEKEIINEVKKIKSDNFSRNNREKSNIAIAILEKWIIC